MQTTITSGARKRSADRLNWPRVKRNLGQAFAYVMLLILTAFILLPLGWMLTVALKPDFVPVFTIPPEWVPTQHWRWENFTRALTNSSRPFLRYTWNTLQIVGGNIVGSLISCTLVAYAFARLRFRGSQMLFNLLIITMLIPWQVLMIPQFLMFHKLGWYGTFLPLIVPSFTGNAFFIFLIRQYMRTFPRDLDEAARIDGCNYWQIFWHIILPLSKPVLAVCVVFVFLGSWNDLLGPLIYLDDNRKFTVAVGLANFVTRTGTDWNLLMAANLIAMLPALIVYFFAQDKLIGGIASVGLKG
ncbi:MAG: sugar ABC transporter permease [uncultured Chloroflexia bacterium]|uniref:Sugar ABC transporter permease n=1 Tax=uncultured Chloroflexia bacterium TaxID=1672391 RepID=A0A6J4KUJ3_9CHLR|nr:MAG: sugar ABC transporter permease [uncultured Chloroflexia bacterium]